MTNKKKLRVAFIGAGGISIAHLTALKQIDEVEVVALADPDTDAMKARAKEYNLDPSNLYTDYLQMLESVKPDAVDICTPNAVHAPASIASSNAGAHVIVEKPMAMTDQEAREMIAAAKKADRKLVVGFQYRYRPKTLFLKRAADEGHIGKPLFARVQAMRRRGIPNWGVFGRKDLQGGGPLIDIGVHALEMAHFVMGSPKPIAAMGMTQTYLGNQPSDISCRMPNWDYKTYTVEDLAVGHIRFDTGAVLHIESMYAGHIDKDLIEFQIMGEKGGCAWSNPKIFTDCDGHMVNIEPAFLESDSRDSWFYHKLLNFVEHILYDTPTKSPAEDGLMVQQMLNAIYRSSENGGQEVLIK